MSTCTLTDLLSLINQQIASREVLRDLLAKIAALLLRFLEKQFHQNIQAATLADLWIIFDVIGEARTLNQRETQQLQDKSLVLKDFE